MSKDWGNYQEHVLFELGRLNDNIMKLDRDVNKIYVEIAMLKVKSSIWGASFGILFGIITTFASNYFIR